MKRFAIAALATVAFLSPASAQLGDAARDFVAPCWNPGQNDGLQIRVSLDDFVRNPAQGALNGRCVHDRDGGRL